MKKRDIFRHGFLSVLLLLPAKAIQAQPANDDFDAATIVAEPLPFNDAIFTGDATTAPYRPIHLVVTMTRRLACTAAHAVVWNLSLATTTRAVFSRVCNGMGRPG